MPASKPKNLAESSRVRIERLEVTVSRLTVELDWLRKQMEPKRSRQAVKTGLAAAVSRGEASKLEWVTSGEVVSARRLADAWGLTPQALGPAAERGEVFAIVVKRQRYFPKEFLELGREHVAAITSALGSLSPSEKLVFWKRSHGALGGKTVLESLVDDADGGQLDRIAKLARTWSSRAESRR